MALFLRKLTYKPKRILVARTDRIGDFILTLPVLEALKKGGVEPSILCQSAVTPLLENNPFVDQIITVDDPDSDPIDAIRSHEFECLLVLVNDPIIRGLLPYLKHIPLRIGPLSKPSVFFAYTHPVLQKRSRSLMNEAEYNLELLEVFGLKVNEPIRPQLYFRDSEIQAFQTEHNGIFKNTSNEPLIIFHQGMGGSALNWREESYRILLEGLLDKGYRVILTGNGEEEAERNRGCKDSVHSRFPDRISDLTNQLSLRQLGLLIHLADLFIGPSTGPTHLANAVGTENISFYPPIQVQTKRRWGPYLSSAATFTPNVHCGQKYHCIREKCSHFYCMDLILPGDVLAHVQELLPISRV